MAKKKVAKKAPRNYRREYDLTHSSTSAKKDRAARNKTRRQAEADGRVKKGDGKDVHHKDGNPRNTAKKNTKVMARGANRAKK